MMKIMTIIIITTYYHDNNAGDYEKYYDCYHFDFLKPLLFYYWLTKDTGTIIMIIPILRMRMIKDFILKMFNIWHQLHAIITCIQITSHASKENQTIAKKVRQYQRKSYNFEEHQTLSKKIKYMNTF